MCLVLTENRERHETNTVDFMTEKENAAQCIYTVRACLYACVKLQQQFVSWLNLLVISDLMEIATDR